MSTIKQRDEVPTQFEWDLESIFASSEDWEEKFKEIEKSLASFDEFQGKLGQDPETLLSALKLRDNVSEHLNRVTLYANLKSREDLSNSLYQALADRASELNTRFEAATAFYKPEMLMLNEPLSDTTLQRVPELYTYQFYFKNLQRQQAYIQSQEVEAILAKVRDVTRFPETIFNMLSYVDMKFPTIHDEAGKEVELTAEGFWFYLEHSDRKVRLEVYDAYFKTLAKLRNTFSANYAAVLKRDIFEAEVRGYESSLHASLDTNNIPVEVYSNLIDTIQNHQKLLYRIMRLRKRLLNLDQLYFYDLLTPMVPSGSKPVTYEQACKYVIDGLAPFGSEYIEILKQGLYKERWVDVYETPNKRGGAFSWGEMGTKPFILLNWKDNLSSLMTLAHELGHSMHTHYTTQNQPFVYANYTIFVAEVASTCNEILVSSHLLRTLDDKEIKLQILDKLLDRFYGTVVVQSQFAEFELEAHRLAEAGNVLTVDQFDELYKTIMEKYAGPDVVVDSSAAMLWMAIPHFYWSYYVYQYATGMSAALALANQILEEGEPAVERYLTFLKSGSSQTPIELLKRAGVDMTTPKPIEQAMQIFERWVDEFETLVGPE